MTTKNTLTPSLTEMIKKDMVRGYRNENGEKVYPKLTEAADWYNVSYDGLKQKARKWNWKQRREDYKRKVSLKVAEKKENEEISDLEAEEIIVDNIKFNNAATLLRRAATKEIQKILDGDQILKVLDDGTIIKGVKSAGYQLMNLGKALESAQKISKIAAGEPSEITKNETDVRSEGKYTVTRSIICSEDHINHEIEVLNAASKAQGCNK
ncbi:hypothetical protein BRM9_1664 [Methanobacterium formicicum]|uniref:Uncharacterized protein n=1 Tax=Methanobacterium formicicum TaxID=2162 RepID=A0A089ZCG3_METFO|nr:hypothetical protein [Methanobacterium formicicum]AIS32476.1 hypothetical protein BRM9_1664 [Methanobacterium formicicum]